MGRTHYRFFGDKRRQSGLIVHFLYSILIFILAKGAVNVKEERRHDDVQFKNKEIWKGLQMNFTSSRASEHNRQQFYLERSDFARLSKRALSTMANICIFANCKLFLKLRFVISLWNCGLQKIISFSDYSGTLKDVAKQYWHTEKACIRRCNCALTLQTKNKYNYHLQNNKRFPTFW